jgi:hypothetical protein
LDDPISILNRGRDNIVNGTSKFVPPPSRMVVSERARKEREALVKRAVSTELTDIPQQTKIPTAAQVISFYKDEYETAYDEKPLTKKYATPKLASTILKNVAFDLDHIKDVLSYAIREWKALRDALKFRPVRPPINYVLKLEIFIIIRDYMVASDSEKRTHHFVDRASAPGEYKQEGFFDDV